MKHIDAGTDQLNDDTDDDGRKPDDVRLEDPGSIYEIPCFLDKYERQLPIIRKLSRYRPGSKMCQKSLSLISSDIPVVQYGIER